MQPMHNCPRLGGDDAWPKEMDQNMKFAAQMGPLDYIWGVS